MPTPTLSSTQKVELKSLLGDLVKFPTIAGDNPTAKAALDWIKFQLRELPLYIHEYEHQGFPSVVFTTRQTKHPKVLLVAHIDVVPAPVEMFSMKEKNGHYIGRGVFDMKQATAIYMKLMLELGDNLPNYDFGVMLTSDEEVTGEAGVGYLVDHIGWRTDVVINLDAIGNWTIEEKAKGFTRYAFESTGTAGHGSRTWMAQNAIVPLMACLQEIATHFPPEPCGDNLHGHNTINIAVINGGTVTNQVPDHATAEIDIRFMPGQTVDDFTALVQDVVAKYPTITARHMWGGNPVNSPANDYSRLMELLIAKVAGAKAKYVLSHGGSDCRFFADHGIPTILTGPPGGGHHSDDEWIDIKGCEQLYRITSEFIREIARTS